MQIAPLVRGTADVAVQTTWLKEAIERGPVAGYEAVLDYPPGTTLVMWAVTSLLDLPLEHAVKLVSAGALVLGALIIGRLVSGRAAIATVSVFAYPTVILGYTDSLFLAPLAVAVFCRQWGTRLLAVVVLVSLKWTALILCPVFLMVWVTDVGLSNSFRFRRVIGDLTPALVAVLVLFFTYGPRTLIYHLGVSSITTQSPSANAFNVHWLISWFWFDGAPYGSEVYETIPGIYRLLFQVLVVVLIGVVTLWGARKAESYAKQITCLRVVVIVYFLFAAFSVHENHLFLAVAVSLMAENKAKGGAVTVVLATAYLLNLFLYYGFNGWQRPLELLGRAAVLPGLSVALALLWVGIRDSLTWVPWRRGLVEMRDAQR